MKKINWEVRVKNPVFWIGLIGAIGTPILAYFGINTSDLTSWGKIGDTFFAAISNPYLLNVDYHYLNIEHDVLILSHDHQLVVLLDWFS